MTRQPESQQKRMVAEREARRPRKVQR